ncbi:putative N-acetyl-LL-diaminopimelate aminotransferase [archaeon BMS3Bbin16]|nr:putative N-acetyl-LL-diaminopimelate aminotransferase [archaeon BMS3Bbin16]
MGFSKRTSYIDISGIRRMFELSKGEDTINLGLGEPDFPIPPESKEAVRQALDADFTHYTPGKGIIELREGIAAKLKRNGIFADPEEIIVTSGASEALEIVLLALVDSGDEVIIPDPGFVSYAPLTRIAGGVPVSFVVTEENSFEFDPAAIEEKITDRTKAIILNSPGNPTGALTRKKDVKEIAGLADDHGIFVISDEVYDEIIYMGEHYSIGRYTDLAITVNAFSKTYAMTGLRLGYLHAREDAVEEILKIHQYVQASTCSLSQAAAVAALKSGDGFTKEMVRTLAKRRDLIVGLLSEIEGVRCLKPGGAFYVFPNVSELGRSAELAMSILKNTGVIVTPGTAFGKKGEGYIRLSYATSEENIVEGVGRIAKYLNIYMGQR